jgi:hypothetical protein
MKRSERNDEFDLVAIVFAASIPVKFATFPALDFHRLVA